MSVQIIDFIPKWFHNNNITFIHENITIYYVLHQQKNTRRMTRCVFRDTLGKHRLIERFFEFLRRFCARGVRNFCKKL